MQSTIDKGKLDGRLECPKCATKVGAYAWQGMRCSCGMWVTPSFSLAKSKVDEIKRVKVNALGGLTKGRGLTTDVAQDGVKSRV